MQTGQFPATRMRRNRFDAWTRRLVQENTVTTDDLIYPMFIIEGRITSYNVCYTKLLRL